MATTLSEKKWHREDDDGHCTINHDWKEEQFFIKYHDKNGKFLKEEYFPNKSLRYIEDAAENWCLGIKKI